MADTIARWRLKMADKLLSVWLTYNIDNIFFTSLIYNLYKILLKNAYIREYKPANHHYIPQFLLKKFAIPSTGAIYQYESSNIPERVSIEKKAAHSPNLYSFKDKEAKSMSDFLENQIFANLLEKHASKIINKILKQDCLELSHIEQNILASFVSFQYVRTPKFLAFIRLVFEYLHLNKKIPLEYLRPRTLHFLICLTAAQIFLTFKKKEIDRPVSLGTQEQHFGIHAAFSRALFVLR